jgi:hypothetical protein
MDRTNAERQRRYIARLKARVNAAPDDRVRKLQEHCAWLHGVIDEQHRLYRKHHAKWVAYAQQVEPALKEAVARIRELEAELARERARHRRKQR